MSYNPANPNGQATSANSSPVVIASDQSALPVSADVTSMPTESLVKASVLASTSGNTTVINPPAGKAIRLFFFGYSASPSNTDTVQVSLRFGSNSAFDNQFLMPGQPYARNICAGRMYIQGATNEALIVNLSAAQNVYCNLEYWLM